HDEHARPTHAVHRRRAPSLCRRTGRRSGRADPLHRDARADDAVLGRVGVHHRRARIRHSPSSREPAFHPTGARVGTAPTRRRLRAAHQPARRSDERGGRRVLVPDRGALVAPDRVTHVVAALGTSVDLFMPIRAHFDPYLNEGEPTTWQALQAVLARAQFGKPSVFANPMYPPGPDNPGHTLVLYGQQLLNYLQYFTWQFGHDWDAAVQRFLALAFAAVGLAGARRQWRAERRAALAMTTLVITLTVALVFYLNFRWGFSQPYNAPGLEHEVRERDYFFIASFALWGIWVG